MIAWAKQYGKTHLFYIILIVAGAVAFNSWRQEHDARLLADQKVRQDEQLVKSLQDGITSRDAAAERAKADTAKLVASLKTPAQVVAAVPTLTSEPVAQALQARPAPDDPNAVEVQAVPFAALLGQFKDAEDGLQTCQMDLADTQKIALERADEVKALKKKPRFWKRVGSVAKQVGLGIVTGILIAEVRK
jgi:predicted negative regulator of RcsB-dependent stress response